MKKQMNKFDFEPISASKYKVVEYKTRINK